jgi:hypothetical protein
LADFVAVLASLDTLEGSRAAAQALVEIAKSPETKLRNDAMESLIKGLNVRTTHGETLLNAAARNPEGQELLQSRQKAS